MLNFKSFLLVVFFLSFISFPIHSQAKKTRELKKNKEWFLELDLGIQMSGIKPEDFVKSNYSPLYRLSAGKWVTERIALKFGYQGRHFNTISHTRKRFYDFYHGEVVFDVKKHLKKENISRQFHELLFHLGGGYFYNFDYNRPNITGIIGVTNNFYFWDSYAIKLDISSVFGWDIYQNNDDILPSISLGVVYLF